MRAQEAVKLVQHNARAYPDTLTLKIQICDFACVPAEIDYQSLTNRATDQARPRASRYEGHACLQCGLDKCARLSRVARKGDGNWFDLVK
jgi:hypothetical protein